MTGSLDMSALGHRVRDERRRRGFTLEALAAASGVSRSMLSEVERGRKEASSEVLAAVCDALRVDLSDVLAEVGLILDAHRAPVVRLHTTLAPPARRSGGDVVLLAA